MQTVADQMVLGATSEYTQKTVPYVVVLSDTKERIVIWKSLRVKPVQTPSAQVLELDE